MRNHYRLVIGLAAYFVLTAAARAETAALRNPFYAMDTAGGSAELLKELGYAGSCATLNGNAKAVRERVAEFDAKGLKTFALYAPCTLTKDELKPDAALSETITDLKGRETVIWLYISSRDFKPSSPEGDEIAVKGLTKIADLAAMSNLRVAIYPHMGNWTERVQDALRVAKKVQRDNFGVSFNLCHCLAAGDEEKVLDLLAEAKPHLFMLTLNGADSKGKGWGQLIQPIGEGTYDLLPVLKKVRAIGYAGPIGFQGFGIKGDRRAILSKSMEAWKKLSAKAAE